MLHAHLLLILLLLEGQAGEDWETTKKATRFRTSWNFFAGNLQTRQCFFGYLGTFLLGTFKQGSAFSDILEVFCWEPSNKAVIFRISWNFFAGNLQRRQRVFGYFETFFAEKLQTRQCFI
jgi:hypothetical protein